MVGVNNSNSSSSFIHLADLTFVDILLPYGIYLNIEVPKSASLEEIIKKLWKNLEELAYIDKFNFKSPDDYILISVSNQSEKLEFYDKKLKLCQINLLHPFFKLVELDSINLEEKVLNSDLSRAVGFNLDDLNFVIDPEILDFRIELYKIVLDRIQQEIADMENINLIDLNCQFKSINYPNLEIDPSESLDPKDLDESMKNSLFDLNNSYLDNLHKRQSYYYDMISINVFDDLNNNDKPINLEISLDWTLSQILTQIYNLKYLKENDENNSDSNYDQMLNLFVKNYVLSVCGCDEVIYSNEHKIGAYKYVRKCISNEKVPSFYLNTFKNLRDMLPKENKYSLCRFVEKSIAEQQKNLDSHLIKEIVNKSVEISWNSNNKFQIYINFLTYFPYMDDCEKIYLKCALFHGQDQISDIIESNKYEMDHIDRDFNYFITFDETINFDVYIKHLHRCSTLFMCINYITKKKKETISIGALKLNLFDYNGYLIDGRKDFYFWQVKSKENFFNIFNSHPINGSCPNKDYIKCKMEFINGYDPNQIKIIYPNKSQQRRFTNRISSKIEDDCLDEISLIESENSIQLESIIKKDSLAELTEQEKNVLWRRRYECLNYPNSLPKLLQSVKWHKQSDLVETYRILEIWNDVKPIVAMELLSNMYADINVRNFAVKCLDKYMKNEEIQQYLLQFVQALKNETYYNNSLCKFLLRRSLQSVRLGFDLFWILKSEMKNVKCKYKFGLIMEAYCRAADTNLKVLIKQIEAVDKFSGLTQTIKSNPDNLWMINSGFLQNTLMLASFKNFTCSFPSPTNKSNILGMIEPDECKILSSAKRPLFLTWKNDFKYSDFYENKFQLIFKHGDDLRQDMLTLQILKIIDIIWKREGLDLKMLIYDVFSTGFKLGFIEVIKQSLTVFKIQTEGGAFGRYQIDTSHLYKWLLINNPNKIEVAVDNFTKSCAGFCVATYVLGIGDRHPDNIMVNKNGKLFHIDFGHFLGHFKKKLGIRRERVPFVLTEDFTRVIAKGSPNPIETNEFQKFRNLCENAYMVLRRYSNLIITLFTLMLSSGMPELQSQEDLIYLRKKLAIDESDENALRIFRDEFAESHRFSIKTKIDWFFHSLNKSNRI